jgi:hypothetical protein
MSTSIRLPAAILVLLSHCACGDRPSRVGVLVNEIGIAKTRRGEAPADVTTRQFASSSSLLRARPADVVADDMPELLVELEDRHGIEIRDRSGARLARLTTTEYLTDFGAISASRPDKQDVILFTYPNAAHGGTFTVLTAGQHEVAKWDEYPPPGGFAVGTWARQPAVFYVQDDHLTARSAMGRPLAWLNAPEGRLFNARQSARIADDRTVILASGNGYTPYHMVCVYNATGKLVFQDIANEQAFELQARETASAFTVITRSSEWRYTIRSPPMR